MKPRVGVKVVVLSHRHRAAVLGQALRSPESQIVFGTLRHRVRHPVPGTHRGGLHTLTNPATVRTFQGASHREQSQPERDRTGARDRLRAATHPYLLLLICAFRLATNAASGGPSQSCVLTSW